jgi:hypothetical protein
MGANAQIEVPAFTAGQVLTAAEMTQINTGIPVFATTVTRDAAFGGAGEKVLAQGQYAYIEATSALMVYTGAAWVVAGGGLTFINSVTATAGATATIDGCFTSTYENYKIIITGVASVDTGLTLQLRVGGVSAATNYGRQRLVADSTSVSGSRSTGDTSLILGGWTTLQQLMHVEIGKPAVAAQTTFLSLDNYQAGAPTVQVMAGQHSTATAYDGFVLAPQSGNISLTAYVYGYGK